VARFQVQRRVDRQHGAARDHRQQGDRGGIIAAGVAGDRRRAEIVGGAQVGIEEAGAAGYLEAFAVPGLHGVGIGHYRARRAHQVGDRGGGHQAQFQRLLRADAGALEQDRQRLLHADQARQALRAAGARNQPERYFRQGQLHARIVQRHAGVAGQRQFQAAAHGRAVDGRHERLAAGFQLAQQRAHQRGDGEGVFPAHRHGKLFDHGFQVAAGHEIALGRRDHGAAHRAVALHAVDHRGQVGAKLRCHHIGGAAGDIDGDNGHAVVADFILESSEHGCSSRYGIQMRSMTVAVAMPMPTHSDTTP
jgi:hypothetical protein